MAGALLRNILTLGCGPPLVLLSGRIATAWAVAACGFHAGILALMAIVFPYPLLGFAFLPFFPLQRIRLPRWLTESSRQSRLSEG